MLMPEAACDMLGEHVHSEFCIGPGSWMAIGGKKNPVLGKEGDDGRVEDRNGGGVILFPPQRYRPCV